LRQWHLREEGATLSRTREEKRGKEVTHVDSHRRQRRWWLVSTAAHLAGRGTCGSGTCGWSLDGSVARDIGEGKRLP